MAWTADDVSSYVMWSLDARRVATPIGFLGTVRIDWVPYRVADDGTKMAYARVTVDVDCYAETVVLRSCRAGCRISRADNFVRGCSTMLATAEHNHDPQRALRRRARAARLLVRADRSCAITELPIYRLVGGLVIGASVSLRQSTGG